MANVHRMTKKRLGELLLTESVITNEQLAESLDEQKQTGELIGDILVRRGFCTESDVARTISTQFSFPYLSVMNYHIDSEMTELFSLETLEKNLFVPIDRFGNVLSVVVAGLLDRDVIDEIEEKSGCSAQVYVGMVSEVKQIIRETFAPAAAARQTAEVQKAEKAPVDVTAPLEAKPAESKADEIMDLSEAILAADANEDSPDPDEKVVDEAEKNLDNSRFFEQDAQDKESEKG